MPILMTQQTKVFMSKKWTRHKPLIYYRKFQSWENKEKIFLLWYYVWSVKATIPGTRGISILPVPHQTWELQQLCFLSLPCWSYEKWLDKEWSQSDSDCSSRPLTLTKDNINKWSIWKKGLSWTIRAHIHMT